MRAIDADSLMHGFMDKPPDYYHTSYIVGEINIAPTLDVMPVKRGRWITEGGDLICPVCGAAYNEEILWMYKDESDQDCGLSYCPHCAAKLER